VLLFTVIVAIAGAWAFMGLAVEAFPDPTDTQVNVITLFPGQPAEEVERQLGLPLERALNGTPGLARLRDLSLFGLSYITMTFDEGVDAYFARQQTLERLRNADLPSGITAKLGPLATPIGEVYRYTLAGAGGDPMKLRSAQDWIVRPRLLRVPGVADVVSYGGLVKEMQVQPSPARLAAFGLTLEDLEKALREASINASGGVLERGSEQFVIRSTALFASLGDIGATGVATHQIVLPGIRESRLPGILDGIANSRAAGNLHDPHLQRAPRIFGVPWLRSGRQLRDGLSNEGLPRISAVLPGIRKRVLGGSPGAELPGILFAVLPGILQSPAHERDPWGMILRPDAAPARGPLGDSPGGGWQRQTDQDCKCNAPFGHDTLPFAHPSLSATTAAMSRGALVQRVRRG
jgi:hypothetical protein